MPHYLRRVAAAAAAVAVFAARSITAAASGVAASPAMPRMVLQQPGAQLRELPFILQRVRSVRRGRYPVSTGASPIVVSILPVDLPHSGRPRESNACPRHEGRLGQHPRAPSVSVVLV